VKLFYITKVMIPSGAAQSVQIASMCEAFSNQSIEFELFSPLSEDNKNINKSFKWNKIKLYTKFRYLEMILRMVFIVLKQKPSHIFTREIAIAYIFSIFNLKVTYEAHKEPRTSTANFMIKALRKKENFLLVTISQALKDYYIKEYNYEDKKIFDYHDAVFIEKYDELRKYSQNDLREELNLPKEKQIVMHTGSLYDGRGAEHFETILKNFKDLFFVQVGGTKEDILKYKEKYIEYRNIKFIGHQENATLIKYQMCADLLFYPMTKATSTYWCCSPMKMFEFMATGIPVLSSNVGSVSEVLNETNSIPFNPEDEQSIVDGIRFYLEKKEETELRAKKALQDVREKYIWEKRVEKILEFIE